VPDENTVRNRTKTDEIRENGPEKEAELVSKRELG
jgi:hypothetical protein